MSGKAKKKLKRLFRRVRKKLKKTFRKDTAPKKAQPKPKPEQGKSGKPKNEATERHIMSVMEKTGWDRAAALAAMRAAKKDYGVSFGSYDRNDFFKYPPEKQKAAAEHLAKLKKPGKSAEKEHAIACIMEATGWDRSLTEEKIAAARERTGCTAKEYFIYRFFELSEEEQGKVFLICDSKKLREKYDTDKQFIAMLCNKEETDEFFEEYLKRQWCVNTKITQNEFIKRFSGVSGVIYKPLGGNRGRGVESFRINSENIADVYNEIASFPPGVVEEYIHQHPDLNRLTDASVNTLRIVTISSKTSPVTPDGRYADAAYAALRIGGGHSVVDNFHSGGMTAAVDLETGIIVTDAADMEGHVFAAHPVTGTVIKGFKVPYFKEAVEMALDAISKNRIGGYIGWDIAITDKGPVLVEVNAGPGVVLLSTPYAAEHKGMKYVMEKYL